LNNLKTVENLSNKISNEISVMLGDECKEMGGIWMPTEASNCTYKEQDDKITADCKTEILQAELAYDGGILKQFYTDVTGKDNSKDSSDKYTSSIEEYGRCYENSVKLQCEWQDEATGSNGYAKYENGKCIFATEWYEYQCKQIGGYYVDNQCYIAPQE
jgi:hypothetical protein